MSLVQSFSPPLLNTQGRKTQPQWLLNWFKNVSMIRPHLQVRMPSFDYTDEEWNDLISYFQQKDNPEWRSATVPGCVHLDLLANDLIPEPFYGTNEKDIQWISEKDWSYRLTFQPDPDLFKQDITR